MKCEKCEEEHGGTYGSGRFCSSKCARGFSTKNKRDEINRKVSMKLTGRSQEPREGSFAKTAVDWAEVQRYYDEGNRIEECIKKFGFSNNAWAKASDLGLVKSNRHRYITPLDELMTENSSYNRGNLKRRLLNDGILKNECALCGLQNEWNGKSIIHHLDHINGVHNDHRLENLRMICPNCHSQTPTYAGRNAHNDNV